jgi:hypothetical protein
MADHETGRGSSRAGETTTGLETLAAVEGWQQPRKLLKATLSQAMGGAPVYAAQTSQPEGQMC